MNNQAIAISLLLGLTALTGCTSSDDAGSAGAGTAAPAPAGAGPTAGGTGASPMGGMPAAAGAGATGQVAGSEAGKDLDSWSTVAKRVPGFPAPAAGQAGAGKPAEVAAGVPPPNRADPFESFRKIVVPEIPAYTIALPRRLAAEYRPPAPKVDDVDPNLTKGPLPPVPRRIAGVMYNGAITAILETGDANGSVQHDVIRPGSVVPSGIADPADLVVESITMKALVLRAADGRSVEVKLSGLPPAVADALRGQFGNGTGNAGGDAGMGVGAGGGGGAAGPGAKMGN
ncbi:MAG: hypothetical protein ACKO5K_16850 [Armatimonadota bacterium]